MPFPRPFPGSVKTMRPDPFACVCSARAWDAKTIVWQKVDSDGTKWSVLEGRSDVPGEAFTYAAFVPAGFHEFHSHATDARVAVALDGLVAEAANLTVAITPKTALQVRDKVLILLG